MPAKDRIALYFRMSKDTQEHSIERQRSQVEPYVAARGYAVVREYEDPGIPGDEIEKRPQFRRMLADAGRGLFDVIVCDDVDRFGRFDPIRYGAVVEPVRAAGVRLETVAQGEIDWNDTLSVLGDTMRMAFKAEQSRDSARRILTRFLAAARVGQWIGKPPYGYAKDAKTKKLVPHPRTAEVVRWLFRTYADKPVTLAWLANELRARAVPAPNGGDYWQTMTLCKLLKNRNYLGDYHWGVRPHGKHYRYAGVGQARKVKGRPNGRERTAPEQWTVVPDCHPKLVERDVFERVQARLADNRRKTTPHVAGGAYLLNQLMVCGHCGHYMVGLTKNGKRLYRCGGYNLGGKKVCNHNTVEEAPLLDCMIRKIEADYLNPDNLRRLREEIKRQDEEDQRTGPERARHLRDQLTAAEKKVKRASERLLDEDDKTIQAALRDAVRERVAERDRLQKALAGVEEGTNTAKAEAEVDEAESYLWRLREALTAADPIEVKAVLHEIVSKVQLFWTHATAAKGERSVTKATFSQGVIYIRQDEYTFRLSNPATAASWCWPR
jgi:DNA invertase Pin-like site-specific DNA recombinase